MTKARYPLRKITETLFYPRPEQGWFAQQQVKLECGHTAWVGTATTYRARCRQCSSTRRADHGK